MLFDNILGFVVMVSLLVMYLKLHPKWSEVINGNDEESAGLVNEGNSDYGSNEINIIS